jgi:serine/threonine protein kinase
LTTTAKAKAVAGLVLGLRFAHSLGILHVHLTGRNIFFDSDGKMRTADFCVKHLAEQEGNSRARAEVEGFSREDWPPKPDVLAFAEILSCRNNNVIL